MIRTRGKGVTYGEVWFDEEPVAPMPDILICRQRSQPKLDGHNKVFSTLLIDLTQDESALHDNLEKNNRYHIRRAATKDGGTVTFIDSPLDDLDPFCDFYDRFAATKGLEGINRTWMREAAKAGRLCLSCVTQAGEVRVWHAYVVSGGRARLIYSASLFRAIGKDLQAVIGRLNRWLHWRDMLEFKRRGFQVYDFGGVFDDESSPTANGINRFKRDFGGVRVRSFDSTVPLTWKGRLYLALQGMRSRIWRDRASV